MKAFLKTKLAKILIIVIVVLLLGGGVLAATTLWSGTASITIEVPEPMNGGGGGGTSDPELLPLEITSINATLGTVVDGTWVVTFNYPEESNESLIVSIKNPRTTDATILTYVNSKTVDSPICYILIDKGVKMHVYERVLPAGLITEVEFQVLLGPSDTPPSAGTLPDILLEIREIE